MSARVSSDVSSSNSGSGGSTYSQLLLSSASASADVSVTRTHVTPDASEGESVVLLLLSLVSSLLSSAASAVAGAAFSSLTGSTTDSSVLAFSFSASAACFSSSSRSFSCYSRQQINPNVVRQATYLLFQLALFGFALLLELFTELALGYDPSCCALSCVLWSGLVFEKVYK